MSGVIGDVWISWQPPWNAYVVGEYTQRVYDYDARMFEEQTVRMRCTACGATWQTRCASGNVRSHIENFARVHYHRDQLQAPLVQSPNSLRTEAIEARRRGEPWPPPPKPRQA